MVGAHFLPLARVFTARVFVHLAVTLVVVGVAGALLVLFLDATWRPWIGVVAGLAVLWFSGPGVPRPHPDDEQDQLTPAGTGPRRDG